MFDEISAGRSFTPKEASRQEELIARHFGDVEERVRSAGSRMQAQITADKVMDGFQTECLSEILPEFLKIYLSTLVEKYWKTS